MKRVGVREFKEHASALLASEETLAIERHGTTIGFFVPVQANDRVSGRAALDRLGSAVAELLDATGMTEDEMVAEVLDEWPSGDYGASRR